MGKASYKRDQRVTCLQLSMLPHDVFYLVLQELAEKFLEGQFALEVFLEQYSDQRKLAHLRRIRIEKLQEILSRARQPVTAAAMPTPPELLDEPRPSPSLPLRPPPPIPRPPDVQHPSAAYPQPLHLPYNPNPGMAGIPQQVMAPYPPAAPAPHVYVRPGQTPYAPYPVQGHFPSGRPPYLAYPMPGYSYSSSGPPPLPARPGCRQPQPGYHMSQPYSQ
ncbi:uncharacterized protein LOC144505312 [Mustelus asterias]